MKITIIGDGGWGTALAIILSQKPAPVTLWSAFPEYAALLSRTRENVKFLPGFKIPDAVAITGDMAGACSQASIIIIAVPSQYVRSVVKKLKSAAALRRQIVVSAAKGFEYDTLLTMSQVIREELPGVRPVVLSGPNIAPEVAAGLPAAAVCAGTNRKTCELVQNALMTGAFRVYTARDVIGVEVAGALKNTIAIACGIADALGFGSNSKGALLTRGLAEISRLGIAMGARPKTFSGLSGMGDLVTTCLSPKSRNRWLGEQLGQGKKLKNILASTEMVVEGVVAAKAAFKLAEKFHVELPIATEVYNVLFAQKDPALAVKSLLSRNKKEELA